MNWRTGIRVTIGVICVMSACSFVSAGLPVFVDGDTVITDTIDKVVGDEIRESDNPIRDGSYIIGEGTDGIYNGEELEDTGTSREKTARYIKGFINYMLGIIGLIAVVYLLYHAFLTLTSGSNQEQYQKGFQGIQYATIAIFGLGASWFILSAIFWLVFQFTNGL